MLLDSHAHLNNGELTAEARQAWVEAIEVSPLDYVMNVGFDPASSLLAAEQAEKYPWCYAAAGCHPHDTKDMDETKLQMIREIAGRGKVMAIGEIGLDYHYDLSDRDVQREWFRRQIRLANELKMPIVIHAREADQEVMDILKEEGAFSDERKSWFPKRPDPEGYVTGRPAASNTAEGGSQPRKCPAPEGYVTGRPAASNTAEGGSQPRKCPAPEGYVIGRPAAHNMAEGGSQPRKCPAPEGYVTGRPAAHNMAEGGSQPRKYPDPEGYVTGRPAASGGVSEYAGHSCGDAGSCKISNGAYSVSADYKGIMAAAGDAGCGEQEPAEGLISTGGSRCNTAGRHGENAGSAVPMCDDARVLLHCFSGSAELGKQYVRLGATISVAGPVTYKNNRKTVAMVSEIPLSFLLVETDSPYLTPVPFRGRPNMPPYVEHTAAKIAEIKGISFETVAEQTKRNAMRFYGIE